MGLGAWLAAQSDIQRYDADVERLKARSIDQAATYDEVLELFRGYGVSDEKARTLVEDILVNRALWLKVRMLRSDEEPTSCCADRCDLVSHGSCTQAAEACRFTGYVFCAGHGSVIYHRGYSAYDSLLRCKQS
jgi:hypothetical protein